MTKDQVAGPRDRERGEGGGRQWNRVSSTSMGTHKQHNDVVKSENGLFKKTHIHSARGDGRVGEDS